MSQTSLFQEDNGNTSWMRTMCFVSLLQSLAIAWLDVLGLAKGDSVMIYVIMFLTAAFAPKAVQKFAEKKIN